MPGQALTLHGEQQTLLRVELDGRTLARDEYVLGPRTLSLPGAGDTGVLVSRARSIRPTTRLSKVCICPRACSARSASRKAFAASRTFFDRPDVLARYAVTIVAERSRFPVLLSNGNLIEQGNVEDRPGFHYAVWDDPVSQAELPVRARRGRAFVARR